MGDSAEQSKTRLASYSWYVLKVAEHEASSTFLIKHGVQGNTTSSYNLS